MLVLPSSIVQCFDAPSVGHVQLDVRVRIGPLERGDDAGDRDRLRRVEHGEGVMGEDACGTGHKGEERYKVKKDVAGVGHQTSYRALIPT